MEVIEIQEGAAPFHDWNAKINFECYAPNAAARILDEMGVIQEIVNNYANISFNFGPTLLSWLEKEDPVTYGRILEADRLSMERFGGHGNALAQVYNHLIMPLANERDKVTQIRWGIADFEHRFGRRPEGMWLGETAADTATLEALVDNGIRFTILAPRQASAFRKMGDEDWAPLHETVDPRRAYRCFLPSGPSADKAGKFIDLFFYDGNVAKDVAFQKLLDNGKAFAERLTGILDHDDQVQLAHIATDGESYGHHHRFGEMALASALDHIEKEGFAAITNYGEFLEKHLPEHEVQIHENSSWSCAHGVERWRSDCGCHTGGGPGWNQAWRTPLRDTLDWLRDELIELYERLGSKLMKDPWAARNEYIELILGRTQDSSDAFIEKHARKTLSDYEKSTFLRLLEMQRHAQLMYTSCAWFFNEISGIETDQVLQYALRAMQYARYVKGPDFREEFEERLAKAPSNIHENGAVSYRQNVVPSHISLIRIGMHYAATVLFEDSTAPQFMHYTVQHEVFERIPAGIQRLAMGRTTVISDRTFSHKKFSFIALYLGQQNMMGSVKLDMTRQDFDTLRARASEAFRSSNIGEVVNVLVEFGDQRFSFKDLLKDEKRSILQKVMSRNLPPVSTVVKDYYEDNYHLMNGIRQANIPLPEGWHGIASYVLNSSLSEFFSNGKMSVTRLQNLADEFRHWEIKVANIESLNLAAGERVFNELRRIEPRLEDLDDLRSLNDILRSVSQLGIKPEFWKSQNLVFEATKKFEKGGYNFPNEDWRSAFLKLSELLNMEIRVKGEG